MQFCESIGVVFGLERKLEPCTLLLSAEWCSFLGKSGSINYSMCSLIHEPASRCVTQESSKMKLMLGGSDGDVTGFTGYGYWVDGNISSNILIIGQGLS